MIGRFCRKRSVKLLRGIGWKCPTSLAGKHRYNLFWGGLSCGEVKTTSICLLRNLLLMKKRNEGRGGLGLFIVDAVVRFSQRKLRESRQGLLFDQTKLGDYR